MAHPLFSDDILSTYCEPNGAFPRGIPDLEKWLPGIKVPGRLTLKGIAPHARSALLRLAQQLVDDLDRGLQVRTGASGHEVKFAGLITWLVRSDRREIVSLIRGADGNTRTCLTDVGTPLRPYAWVEAWFDANVGLADPLIPVMWEAYRYRPAGVGTQRNVTFAGQDIFRIWAVAALTGLVRRHADRRRMANALRRAHGLDPELLRICRLAGPSTRSVNVEVTWFNTCGRHFWQLHRVAQCAPALLPLMGRLVQDGIWHREPPMAALKRVALGLGASEGDWKRMLRASPRTFHDLHALGARDDAMAALAVQWARFHRGLPPGVQLPHQAWLDLAQCILARLGSNATAIRRLDVGLGFSVRLRLDAIRRWSDSAARGVDCLQAFRRDEWRVAIRWIQSRTRMDWPAEASTLRQVLSDARGKHWSTGMVEDEVDGVCVVPIENSAALASEGHELHHCVAIHERDCMAGVSRILGLRDSETGRRLGTIRLQRKRGAWTLVEGKGPWNSPLSPKLMAVARAVARHARVDDDPGRRTTGAATNGIAGRTNPRRR